MAAPTWSAITLYGCDTNNDGTTDVSGQAYPAKTDVAALSGVVTQSYNVLNLGEGIDIESNDYEYLGGYTETKNTIKIKFDPESINMRRPVSGAGTTIESFYGVSALNKNYHWIEISGDYQLRPAGMTTGKLMAVNLTGADIENSGKNHMKISMNLIAPSSL